MHCRERVAPTPVGLAMGEQEGTGQASGVVHSCKAGEGGSSYRWMAVTSVGVLVCEGPWLLEPLGALGAGLLEVWAASRRLSLSAASICSWQARRQSWGEGNSEESLLDQEKAPRSERATSLPPLGADVGEGHSPVLGIGLRFSETGKRMWREGVSTAPLHTGPHPYSGTPFGKDTWERCPLHTLGSVP